MAENYDLIFGQSASQQYAWSDSDYQNGWQTVGSTPPTAEQFDALQRRSDTKAKDLNERLEPLETKAEADGRQAATAYTAGAMLTVDGLPNGWLLECIVPGISGTDAITLPETLIDGLTIIDGTVTWALRKVATNGGIGYRQPNTAYTAGQIAYHSALPTGWYLECTTGGVSYSGELAISSPSIGGTVTDGTVTWKVCKDIGTGNAPIYAGFNQKQTFTSSGSFTAPVTGMYKITLQGGGGGGGSSSNDANFGIRGGGGGGQGGYAEFYASLTAGTSYSYTIGAGGSGGSTNGSAFNKGSEGGDSSIVIGGDTYLCAGGSGGLTGVNGSTSGLGGHFKINGTTVNAGEAGFPGTVGANTTSVLAMGGNGGHFTPTNRTTLAAAGAYGSGGQGGYYYGDLGGHHSGAAGGSGYITFEWLDPTL